MVLARALILFVINNLGTSIKLLSWSFEIDQFCMVDVSFICVGVFSLQSKLLTRRRSQQITRSQFLPTHILRRMRMMQRNLMLMMTGETGIKSTAPLVDLPIRYYP